MECDPAPVPHPPAPPALPDSPLGARAAVTRALALVGDDEAALEEEIKWEYCEMKSVMEEKLCLLQAERAHAVQQQSDVTFIDETIAQLEEFMLEQLTELEDLLRSQTRNEPKIKKTTRKTKKRGVDAIDDSQHQGQLSVALVPDGNGEYEVKDGKDWWDNEQPTKKKAVSSLGDY
jgi:hypothetical protein